MSAPTGFWAKVDIRGDDECWPFLGARTGGRDGDTYGIHARPRADAREDGAPRNVYAHRLAYCLENGIAVADLPPEVKVRHKCDNTICCNPKHLLEGTQADNVQDKVDRNRQLKGEQIANSILKEIDIPVIRQRLSDGERHDDIALDYGVHRGAITQINVGNTWSWVQ